MANFFFDGTASVTAAKSDVVVITANPALFTSQAQSGSNVVFTYSNGTTLTVTGTTLGDSATTLPGVSLANGVFATGATVDTVANAGQNGLLFNGTNALATAPLTGTGAFTANSVHAIFGGNGRSDPNDGADSIQIGGKGSFLAYGNAGADVVSQGTVAGGDAATGGNAFDSTSFVTVFGGKNDLGNDSILLANTANSGAKMAIYGGEGTDSINIFNVGSSANTAIFGGQGAADSSDLADSIAFSGGGTVNIFGNAGNDVISLGGTKAATAAAVAGLDSTANVTVHGGIGNDTIGITVANAKATIVAYGDENIAGNNIDTIAVGGNAGTTVIYGGTAAADSTDGNDSIFYSGQGTATIFAGAGDDSVVINTSGLNVSAADGTTALAGTSAGTAVNGANISASSTTTVFLGNGNDSINVLNTNNATTGTQTITGGAGADTFAIGNNSDATTVAGAQTGIGNGITITDFQVGIDSLRINNSTTGAATTKAAFIAPSGGSLQDALNSASQNTTKGTIGVVSFNGDTYVVVNQDTSNVGTTATGYQAADDLAIKLTGVTDVASVVNSIVIV